MNPPRHTLLYGATLLSLIFWQTPCRAEGLDWSGSIRGIAESADANSSGMLAPANQRMQAGQESMRGEFSLKAKYGPVQGQATLTQSHNTPGDDRTQSLANELYWSGAASDWHFTLGKKIVSWDVGQGFRPLDVIQQENRRTLYGSTLEGVRVAMAERYTADAAWSAVIANPFKTDNALGRDEPALALRYFLRQGSTDWHTVARWGRNTGARAGIALASVVTDSLEIHGSVLRAEQLEHYAYDGRNYILDPGRGGWQGMAGLSWTSEDQLTLMSEYWHDERALSRTEWRQWRNTAAGIPAWLPTDARTGLLANLAEPFGLANLQRDNILLRASWTNNRWSPAADMVYTPADHGHIATLSLNWQGDVYSLEGGIRRFDGPRSSIARNLPDRKRAYLWVKYPF